MRQIKAIRLVAGRNFSTPTDFIHLPLGHGVHDVSYPDPAYSSRLGRPHSLNT
jgi:hypothetical protein